MDILRRDVDTEEHNIPQHRGIAMAMLAPTA
jgi:hypothetical protein